MTAEDGVRATLCSHFVLDGRAKLGYIIPHSRPARGALARRRSTGAGGGPAAGLARLWSREVDLGSHPSWST